MRIGFFIAFDKLGGVVLCGGGSTYIGCYCRCRGLEDCFAPVLGAFKPTVDRGRGLKGRKLAGEIGGVGCWGRLLIYAKPMGVFSIFRAP